MSDSKITSTDIGLLILRVVLGITFILHGYPKVFTGSAKWIETLRGMQVPFPEVSAWLAALSEFGGGILLVLGVFPRIAALAIAGVMIVAIVKVHWQNGFFMDHFHQTQKHGYEFCLNLLAMATMVVCAGGGRFTLEKLLFSKKGGKSS
jgi:putative oxidoreductase